VAVAREPFGIDRLRIRHSDGIGGSLSLWKNQVKEKLARDLEASHRGL